MSDPVGFVTGEVLRDGAAVPDALVRADTLPFVGRTRAGEPRYAVASPIGVVRLEALDLANGDTGRGEADVGGSLAMLDLTLTPFRPRVRTTTPEDGTTGVPIDDVIRVSFDRPMERSTLDGAIALENEAGPVAVIASLSADGWTATIRPSQPLQSETSYFLRIAPLVLDRFGNALLGNSPDGHFELRFTTVDSTPPPRPESGQVSLSIPYDGTSEIEGRAGTTEPGHLVTAINTTTGTSVSVIAGVDGSFRLFLPASLSDHVELSLRETSGLETRFDPGPFADADGFVVVGSQGAILEGDGGVRAVVPAGAVPDGTPIRVRSADAEEFAASPPDGIRFTAGIVVEMGGVVAEDEIDISFPIPAGVQVPSDAQILMLQEVDFFGTPRLTLVNIAHVEGDRIETASPPFPGVRRDGKYFVGPSDQQLSIIPLLFATTLASTLVAISSFDLVAVPNYFPIFAVPVDVPFTIEVYADSPEPVLTLSFGGISSSGLVSPLAIAPPDDGEPFGTSFVAPVDGSAEVPIYPTIVTVLNKEIDETSAIENFRLENTSITDDEQARVSGTVETFLVDTVRRGVRFRPDRRLWYDTTYRISLDGICPFGQSAGVTCSGLLADAESEFTTFRPRRLGGVQAGTSPNDIASWAADPTSPVDRVVVANGTLADADGTGIVVIDVSDPRAPRRLSETAIAGRTLRVTALDAASFAGPSQSYDGPAVLAVSGGIDVASNLRLLRPTDAVDRSQLLSVGASLFSQPNGALLNGVSLSDVPPLVAIPRGLAFLQAPLNGAAYVAALGIGVVGIDTRNTIETTRRMPGIFTLESIVDVATLGSVVLAGDRTGLYVLGTDLQLQAVAPVAVRSLVAARAYTADVNRDGEIQVPAEAFDLALVVEPGATIAVVDLKVPTQPDVLSRIPLATEARSVAIDPTERLLYVGSDEGLDVFDFSDPTEGSPSAVAIDSNGDGVDDRLLGRVADLSGARRISFDREQVTGYTTSLAGTVETSILKIGRFYVETFDPDFPSIRLDPEDYYPDLGAKRILVRAYESDGMPGEGEVQAQILSPSADGTIDPSSPLESGSAVFSFSAPDATPSIGPFILEFTWRDSGGQELKTQTRLRVRNNSITHLEEVLDGRAVFVATTEAGTQYDGVTLRPLEPIQGGYDPTPRPRSFAPVAEQKVDFVQEMLNQVLGRKRSAWENGFEILDEDGIYAEGGEVETALSLFKREFHVAVNTAEGDRSPTFQKLIKDYQKEGEAATALHHRIIDAETLRIDTLRVQAERTEPCTPCDFSINPSGGGDSGLYELYTNVVYRFIEDMIATAEEYRDQSSPANTDGRWVSRDGIANPPSTSDPVESFNLYDGRSGVSYGFGAKQEVDDFNRLVSRFGAPTHAEILVNFTDYRGNLIDDVSPGTVSTLGAYRWPGIKQAEISFDSLDQPFYPPAYWAGIDCAGITQRSLLHARDRNPARADTDFFNATACADGIPSSGVGLCDIVVRPNGWWSGAILGRSFWNADRVARNVWAKNGTAHPVHRGDTRVSQGHVSMLYSDPEKPTDDYYLIHASGGNRYSEGLKGDGTERFGRKVIVSGWRGPHTSAWGVSRPLLWE
jgi:hypothetical protein